MSRVDENIECEIDTRILEQSKKKTAIKSRNMKRGVYITTVNQNKQKNSTLAMRSLYTSMQKKHIDPNSFHEPVTQSIKPFNYFATYDAVSLHRQAANSSPDLKHLVAIKEEMLNESEISKPKGGRVGSNSVNRKPENKNKNSVSDSQESLPRQNQKTLYNIVREKRGRSDMAMASSHANGAINRALSNGSNLSRTSSKLFQPEKISSAMLNSRNEFRKKQYHQRILSQDERRSQTKRENMIIRSVDVSPSFNRGNLAARNAQVKAVGRCLQTGKKFKPQSMLQSHISNMQGALRFLNARFHQSIQD